MGIAALVWLGRIPGVCWSGGYRHLGGSRGRGSASLIRWLHLPRSLILHRPGPVRAGMCLEICAVATLLSMLALARERLGPNSRCDKSIVLNARVEICQPAHRTDDGAHGLASIVDRL